MQSLSFRNFVHYLSSSKVSLTNPNCVLKTDIVCDRSEPTVDVSIVPSIAGKSLIILYNIILIKDKYIIYFHLNGREW